MKFNSTVKPLNPRFFSARPKNCRARKRLWQYEKMKSDKDNNGKQIDNAKRWQKKRQWDKYMYYQICKHK